MIEMALSHVNDPDLGRSLTELGMIENIAIDGNKVSFDLVLTTPSHEVSVTLIQGAAVALAPPYWLELPARDKGPNVRFLVHDMAGQEYVSRSQSGLRNWSCYFDINEHLSYWVAYPLNPGIIGKGSRSNKWAYDPLVPEEYQVNLRTETGGYGGGWSRGHQLPSADRYSPASANWSTFYMTNIAPQNYDFNAGIIGRLEDKVRSWSAVSDTLYVVTGCDIRNYKGFTGSYGGFPVKIPDHFFKALLRKKGNGASAYSAVGFYIPHDQSVAENDFLQYACSIDELETKTGMDFFAVLPSMLGTKAAADIEAASPATTLETWK